MNREQCVNSLKRIFTLQNIGPEHQAAYAKTIMEACGWMDAYRFEEVTKHLCATLKTNWRLKPGNFREAYQSMGESKGWYREEAKPVSRPILWEHVTPRQARNCLAIIEHCKHPYITEAFALKLSEIAAQEPEPMKPAGQTVPLPESSLPALAAKQLERIVDFANGKKPQVDSKVRTFVLRTTG